MAYSEKVIDHYSEPRNVGSLDKSDNSSSSSKRDVITSLTSLSW